MVTFRLAIFSVWTALSASCALVTASNASFAVVTAKSSISLVWIASSPRVTTPIAVRLVNVAADAALLPITVLSIVPALISAVLTINPPAAVISKAWVPEIMTLPLPGSVTKSLPFIYTSVRSSASPVLAATFNSDSAFRIVVLSLITVPPTKIPRSVFPTATPVNVCKLS